MKILKKIGQILLCALPFAVTMLAQFIITIPVTFYYFLVVLSTRDVPSDLEGLINWITYEMLYGDFGIIVTICWGLASLTIFIFWYLKQRKTMDLVPLKKSLSVASIGGLALMVCGLQIAIQYAYTCLEMLKPEWFESYNQLMDFAHYSYPAVIAMFIYSVVVAPIHEEFLIRGVTQNFAKRVFPFWLANIVQALMFGVLHMNLIQGSYAFFVGLLIGYVMHKGKNIVLPIVFHFFFNMFGTWIPLKLLKGQGFSAYLIVIVIGLAIMSAGIVLFNVKMNNRNLALAAKE